MYFFAFRYNFRIRSVLMASSMVNIFIQSKFRFFFLVKKLKLKLNLGSNVTIFAKKMSYEVSWLIRKSFRFFKSWKKRDDLANRDFFENFLRFVHFASKFSAIFFNHVYCKGWRFSSQDIRKVSYIKPFPVFFWLNRKTSVFRGA